MPASTTFDILVDGGNASSADATVSASAKPLASGDVTSALGYTPGSVTSVALSLPTQFSVTGSPVTTTGTLTASWASQTANYVLASPNGSSGVPTFRALVASDIPALSYAPTAGSTSITTLGTIGTGTWQGSVINSTYGGTGVNNGGRTLAVNTNSGTLAFTNASTTLTVANTGSVSGTNTGDQTISLTGDVTGSGTGSFAATLATVNSNTGTFGSASSIPVVTVNGKGLITAVTTATVAGGQYFGSATTKAIAYNSNTIGENVTVTAGNNGISAGPITVSSGFTVTVQTGSRWVIV